MRRGGGVEGLFKGKCSVLIFENVEGECWLCCARGQTNIFSFHSSWPGVCAFSHFALSLMNYDLPGTWRPPQPSAFCLQRKRPHFFFIITRACEKYPHYYESDSVCHRGAAVSAVHFFLLCQSWLNYESKMNNREESPCAHSLSCLSFCLTSSVPESQEDLLPSEEQAPGGCDPNYFK